jgi:hypothetical protein
MLEPRSAASNPHNTSIFEAQKHSSRPSPRSTRAKSPMALREKHTVDSRRPEPPVSSVQRQRGRTRPRSRQQKSSPSGSAKVTDHFAVEAEAHPSSSSAIRPPHPTPARPRKPIVLLHRQRPHWQLSAASTAGEIPKNKGPIAGRRRTRRASLDRATGSRCSTEANVHPTTTSKSLGRCARCQRCTWPRCCAFASSHPRVEPGKHSTDRAD